MIHPSLIPNHDSVVAPRRGRGLLPALAAVLVILRCRLRAGRLDPAPGEPGASASATPAGSPAERSDRHADGRPVGRCRVDGSLPGLPERRLLRDVRDLRHPGDDRPGRLAGPGPGGIRGRRPTTRRSSSSSIPGSSSRMASRSTRTPCASRCTGSPTSTRATNKPYPVGDSPPQLGLRLELRLARQRRGGRSADGQAPPERARFGPARQPRARSRWCRPSTTPRSATRASP